MFVAFQYITKTFHLMLCKYLLSKRSEATQILLHMFLQDKMGLSIAEGHHYKVCSYTSR